MKRRKFKYYTILGQAGGWLIMFMINLMSQIEYEETLYAFLYATTETIFLMLIVYIHYYLLLPLFLKGRYWLHIFLSLLMVTVLCALYYYVDSFIPTNYPNEDYYTWDSLLYYLFLASILMGTSSLFYFVEAWFNNLEKESRLKNEKLQAELNFLKSQINPHFLFNTLNNIYSYAQTGNPKTAPMLESLSSILRFMVYDCSEEKVSLNKELVAVEDLLEIHKMKNSEQRNIKLTTNGIKGYHLIAPLILVNLVENACKHSDVVSNAAGFIEIDITVDENDHCVCKISNSIKKRVVKDPNYSGVGLKNIQKRLELQYENDYKMETETKDNNYYLSLEIPLERKQ